MISNCLNFIKSKTKSNTVDFKNRELDLKIDGKKNEFKNKIIIHVNQKNLNFINLYNPSS